jgi:hypothetical protein
MFALLFFILVYICKARVTLVHVERCVDIAFPYSSSNTALSLLQDVDRCLSRMYIAFPVQYRNTILQQVDLCIHTMTELEKSKSEYNTLKSSITQLTSNLGDSIVEAQHSVDQLSVCGEPLKHITNVEIYEETRFDTTVAMFTQQLRSSDKCLEELMSEIDHQTLEVNNRILAYKLEYSRWLNVTSGRQDSTETCKHELSVTMKDVIDHIMSELHS